MGAEEMYKDNSQMRIEDFVFPYGKLDPENDWVKLAAVVPWDVAEEEYAAQFVNNGAPAHPCRVALGALLIQRRLKCSDRWLVKHIFPLFLSLLLPSLAASLPVSLPLNRHGYRAPPTYVYNDFYGAHEP